MYSYCIAWIRIVCYYCRLSKLMSVTSCWFLCFKPWYLRPTEPLKSKLMLSLMLKRKKVKLFDNIRYNKICKYTPPTIQFACFISYLNTLWFWSCSLSCSACRNCLNNQADCWRRHCVTADGFEKAILTINRRLPAPSIQVSNRSW